MSSCATATHSQWLCVQVMKMDVEGFEKQVLEGATGLLTKHNVWWVNKHMPVIQLGTFRKQHCC